MARFEVRTDVAVPMRDGVLLATDVCLPDAWPAPALLSRTPYDKNQVAGFSDDLDLFSCLRAGYAVVVQDVRGRFGSAGTFEPFRGEAEDGADAVAWVAAQDWCDGTVGMFGKSYLGTTQWQAAVAAPPALRAIAPSMTPSGIYQGNSHHGGVPVLHTLRWAAGLSAAAAARIVAAGGQVPPAWTPDLDPDAVLEHLPLADHPAFEQTAPFWRQWLAHPTDGPYWRSMSPNLRFNQLNVPSLNIAGWYDIMLGPVLENFSRARSHGHGEAHHSRLIIGPWSHVNLSGAFPERSFGASAGREAFGLDDRQLAWFDQWLRGVGGADTDPVVSYFLMGADQWRTASDWPPPGVLPTPFHLHSGGHANTRHGDGRLTLHAALDEPADSFTDDPLHPVPTIGGQTLLSGPLGHGPRNQADVEDRDDVLVYTTEPLEEPLDVAGPVGLVVHLTCDAPDTDLTAKLVDVHPDGRAIILTEGILRARYRNSLEFPRLLSPGQTYQLDLDLWATANRFLPGHRIRLEVAGSNFPQYGRNSHTGGDISNEPAERHRRATIRVLHDQAHPSRLMLPVLPPKPAQTQGAQWQSQRPQ